MDNMANKQLESLNQQFNEFFEIYRQAINRCGVLENEFWIWYSLIMFEGEQSQKEICKVWSLSKQTVNTLVAQMVRKGYAFLEVVPGTRNRKNIHLTATGQAYGKSIVLPMTEAEQRAFQQIPPDDRLTFLRILRQYITFLKDEFRENSGSHTSLELPAKSTNGKPMNLLFAINHKYIPLLLSCLHSIQIRGGGGRYQVYVLHSDLTDEMKESVQQAAGTPFQFQFIHVPENLFAGFPETARYPKQIYYRLAAPLLLPGDLDRVLYLDVDTVVINPLTQLYHTDFAGNWFAACTHTGDFLQKFNKFRLKIEKDVPYINTGVMLMNLPQLRQHLDLEQIRKYGLENQRLLVLPDQDILTALYGDRVKILDTLLYNINDRILAFYNANPANPTLNLKWVRENSVVIHYFGKNKPWEPHYIGILDTFYHEYGLPLKSDTKK